MFEISDVQSTYVEISVKTSKSAVLRPFQALFGQSDTQLLAENYKQANGFFCFFLCVCFFRANDLSFYSLKLFETVSLLILKARRLEYVIDHFLTCINIKNTIEMQT